MAIRRSSWHGARSIVAAIVLLGCGDAERTSDADAGSEIDAAPPTACTANACGRFAQCVEDGQGVRCLCQNGYQGARCTECAPMYQDRNGDGTCEDACTSGVCPFRASCDDSSGTIQCRCEPGYVLSGTECVPDGTVPGVP